jgi:glycosyltransferase involved in cell wall biosynthesis
MSAYLGIKGKDVYSPLFEKGDLFLPISEKWKRKLIELGCDKNKISVHHMGVDCQKINMSIRKFVKNNQLRILTIARLVEKKGVEYGIRAVTELNAKYDNIEYNIIGDGPLRNRCAQLIQESNMENKIHLLGRLDQKQVYQLIEKSHILLCPSVTSTDGDQEGIPVALMEAMAAGLPVISTRHSGIPELVQDGVSGFLVPERNIKELTDKLIYLLEHPEIWADMCRAGRAQVEANYDINKLNNHLVEIYQNLLNHQSGKEHCLHTMKNHPDKSCQEIENGETNEPGLVSVIIPTYNRENYITKAIDSVLNQSYKNYEIIVVDDGSTDNTKEVLEPYMDKIKYIYQDNAGVYTARNVGIHCAKGQWVAFLDSDDQWLPEKLSHQLECMHRTGIQACFTNSVFSDGKQLLERQCPQPEKESVKEKIITDPFEPFIIGAHPLSIQTMLVAKDLLEKTGCFNGRMRIGNDTQLIFNLALETSFVFLHSVHAIINRDEAREGLVNTTLKTTRKRSEVQISILSEAYFHNREKSKAACAGIRHRLGYALSRRAQIACIDKQYSDARRFARDALHFGNDLRTYLRSLIVWLCPQLVTKLYKHHWK